jgi:hypothetical protein
MIGLLELAIAIARHWRLAVETWGKNPRAQGPKGGRQSTRMLICIQAKKKTRGYYTAYDLTWSFSLDIDVTHVAIDTLCEGS